MSKQQEILMKKTGFEIEKKVLGGSLWLVSIAGFFRTIMLRYGMVLKILIEVAQIIIVNVG